MRSVAEQICRWVPLRGRGDLVDSPVWRSSPEPIWWSSEGNILPPELLERVGFVDQSPWETLLVTGGPRKKAYTLGGVVGAVRLSGVPQDWLPHLILGRPPAMADA